LKSCIKQGFKAQNPLQVDNQQSKVEFQLALASHFLEKERIIYEAILFFQAKLLLVIGGVITS